MKKCYPLVFLSWIMIVICTSSYRIQEFDLTLDQSYSYDTTSDIYLEEQDLEDDLENAEIEEKEEKEVLDHAKVEAEKKESSTSSKKEMPIPSPTSTPTPTPTSTPVPTPTPVEEKKETSINGVPLQLVGSLSGYGIDCTGCSTNTASGYSVQDSIYYEDATYGSVRILSADKSYPFGTIVKISNCSYLGEDIVGIVLDRGGGVGLTKRIQFDLLYQTEAETVELGVRKNVNFEVLRFGY